MSRLNRSYVWALEKLSQGGLAAAKGLWVIVVASDEAYSTCAEGMACMAQGGHRYSGRTLAFPGGGKITLISASEDFETEKPFVVLFAGCDNQKVMHKWREKATGKAQHSLT